MPRPETREHLQWGDGQRPDHPEPTDCGRGGTELQHLYDHRRLRHSVCVGHHPDQSGGGSLADHRRRRSCAERQWRRARPAGADWDSNDRQPDDQRRHRPGRGWRHRWRGRRAGRRSVRSVTTFVRKATAPQAWTGVIAALIVGFAIGQCIGPWLSGVVSDARYGVTGGLLLSMVAGAALVALPQGEAHNA